MTTIFCDIDGTILYQPDNFIRTIQQPERIGSLEQSAEIFMEWHTLGYKIILTTGRTECLRKITEEQLLRAGIMYDQLIMDCGSGKRILINDVKYQEHLSDRAYAINVPRNTGLAGINQKVKDIDGNDTTNKHKR